ncbi:hypothetical protein Bca101_060890 [Brassica carinata]
MGRLSLLSLCREIKFSLPCSHLLDLSQGERLEREMTVLFCCKISFNRKIESFTSLWRFPNFLLRNKLRFRRFCCVLLNLDWVVLQVLSSPNLF